MKEIKSFEKIYEELQNKNQEEMKSIWDEAKKESRKRNKIVLLICVILDALILLLFNKNGFNTYLISLQIIFFIDIITIIIGLFCGSKKNNEYRKVFKEKVINDLIANFYDNLEYFPNEKMPSRIYREGQYESYDNYYSDDYIEAKIDGKYDIDMAEVKTEEEYQTTDSDGNTTTHRRTIFHGIFSKIVTDKSVNCEFRIRQNGIAFGKNRLKMDSSEFEKYFDVLTTNKIISMQILTGDIMELLVKFQTENKIKYDIFLKDNNIYLRFFTGPVFELKSIKKGAFDIEMLRGYYNILKFTYELSTKLIEVINETEI